MRRLLVLFVAAICLTFGADGHAQRRHPRARHHAATAKKPKRRRARRPVRSVTPITSDSDELVLSPALLRQLQRNLAAGGYLEGPIDGRLDRRTRRALAEFQRDYHMADTGALDRKTASALLGYDVIAAYTVAAAPSPPATAAVR